MRISTCERRNVAVIDILDGGREALQARPGAVVSNRFVALNNDIKAAGLWQADNTTPNNVHFTVIADYGVRKSRVHYRFYFRQECEKGRAIAQGHGLEAEECSLGPVWPPARSPREIMEGLQ